MTVQPTRDQLRALANAATPGPWEADHAEGDTSSVKEHGREWWDGLAFAGRPADAEFIAAARTAVPQLLDALAAAEHRATRAEAQSAIRGRAVAIHRERTREAEARIEAVRDTLLASDDGTECDHNGHQPFEGEPECPGCWVEGIRRALDA